MIKMDTTRRVAKNTIALYSADIITSILSIILSIAIARQLGDVVFGKYSFAVYFVTLCTQFADLGYTTLSLREVARDKSLGTKYVSNNLSIRTILSLIIFVIIVIVINLLRYPADTTSSVYLFGVCYLVISLSEIFNSIFHAYQKMEYNSIISSFVFVLRAILCLILLYLGYGLIEIALIFAYTAILMFLLEMIVCEKKLVKIKFELDFTFLKTTIKQALPFTLVSAFGFIYVRIDVVMLSLMRGDAVVGWYNAATTLTYGLRTIPHFFMASLLPLLSYYFVAKPDALKSAFEKSFKYLFTLALPISIGTVLLADKIILLLYGEQFRNSIVALQILGWDIFLIFLYSNLSFILISINKQKRMAIIAGITALLNIVLNLFLIPWLSYVGAALSTLIAEGFLFIAYFYVATRQFHTLPLHKIIFKPIFSGIIMGLFIYVFHEVNLFILIIAGCLLYFGVFYLLKGFSQEDINLVKKLIKR